MKILSKVAFWIVIFALLLVAATDLLPDHYSGNYPGDWKSYVGCTYDFKSGVHCFNFVGGEIVEFLLGFGVLFAYGSMFGWYPIFVGVPFLVTTVLAILIVIIDILAVAYVISLIKNNFQRKTVLVEEGYAWEFKIAKILITILLIAAIGRTAVWYLLNPLELERQITYHRPLTISETTGDAPLTVRIIGPPELLALKNNLYQAREWSTQPAPLSHSGCGFNIEWVRYNLEGRVDSIAPDPREGGCASLLSYTFTKPGQYGVRAFIYDPRYGGKETWRSKRIEINVK